METVLAILGIIGALIPIVWKLYQQHWSKKANEKKRRDQEQKDALAQMSAEQKLAMTESQIHKIQSLVEEQFFAGIDYKRYKLAKELAFAPKVLRKIVLDFARKTRAKFGKKVVITRILGKIDGDSGVHAAYRAVDIRDEYKGMREFNDDEVTYLLNYINKKYVRTDGKKVALHHSFDGGPEHWHLQVPQELPEGWA